MINQNGTVLCTVMNGLNSSNYEYLPVKQISRKFSLRDEEMLRLIGQYLCDKGFT